MNEGGNFERKAGGREGFEGRMEGRESEVSGGVEWDDGVRMEREGGIEVVGRGKGKGREKESE